MSDDVIEELRTYVVPVEGLQTPRSFGIGPVTIYPSTDDLQCLEPAEKSDVFNEWIARSTDQYRAVAMVDSDSVENALDTIEQALQVFRVFQYGLMRAAHYLHFGLPGEIYSGKIIFFHKGPTNSGMGFHDSGLHLGFELQESGIEGWENHAESLQMAASAINNEAASDGAKRALNGVKLFSQSILTKDPDLRVLLVMAALEGMLKPAEKRSRSLILARKLSFLSCWQPGHCGTFGGQPCPYLLFNPSVPADQKLLVRLEELSKQNNIWTCTYWAMVITWYDTRSGIAHGNPEGLVRSEASRFAYWAYHQYVGPVLTWMTNHPDSPVEELDIEIAALRAEGVDWREIVNSGKMPDSDEGGAK